MRTKGNARKEAAAREGRAALDRGKPRRVDLQQLTEMIRRIEARSDGPPSADQPPAGVAVGWALASKRGDGEQPTFSWSLDESPSIANDAPPPLRLARGVIHEWLGVCDAQPDDTREPWTPPLLVAIHLAWCAVEQDTTPGGPRIFWIGRRVWPHALALLRGIESGDSGDALLRRSIFVDPPDDAARWWAIDLVLRSPAALAVIADGHALDMRGSRRLQ